MQIIYPEPYLGDRCRHTPSTGTLKRIVSRPRDAARVSNRKERTLYVATWLPRLASAVDLSNPKAHVKTRLTRLRNKQHPPLSTQHKHSAMSRASIEQALTGLVPTLTGPLPTDLVDVALSLLALSRSVAHSLKPDEEIARPYACAQLACERYFSSSSR